LVLSATAALAQGGPPLVTDDPGTPGNRRWEINVAIATDKRAGDVVLETPLIDANYGWGERVQLKVEIPWIVRDENAAMARSGLGNALVGVKWRFLDEDKNGIAVAFYPQLEVNVLTSSADRGLVERGVGAILPLAFQKDLGPFSANIEIGHLVHEGEKPHWFGGIAFGRDVSKRVELVGEVFAETSTHFSATNASWNVGGRWKAGPLIVLFSAGSGIHSPAEVPPTRFLCYTGAQLLF
jgi:hypothetical protein